MHRTVWGIGLGALAAATVVIASVPSTATPLYSIRAANRCDTCHIEPIGWYDPPEKKDRACTLDCQACHVNRTGGALRNSYGRYYADDTLPTFVLDARPSTFGDPESHRGPNDPSVAGAYSIFDGFSGWQSGTTPVQEVEDRTGDIDPDPAWRAGFDARFLYYRPDEGDPAFFPMQLDAHGWGRITPSINVYGTVGLQGRRARTVDDPNVGATFDELVTLRELAVEYDEVPYNGYVRAGRFTKPYGWRHPDHTLFIRNPLNVGQYGQVFGVEAGVNPNYPFAQVAAFYQGIDAFPGERVPSGTGVAGTAGYRDLGYQLAGSFEVLFLEDAGSQYTAGPLFGVNLYPWVVLGEIDYRLSQNDTGDISGLYTYLEINYLIFQGITALSYATWSHTDLSNPDTRNLRVAGGVQWDVLPSVQLGAQYRSNFPTGASMESEFLLWTHLWY